MQSGQGERSQAYLTQVLHEDDSAYPPTLRWPWRCPRDHRGARARRRVLPAGGAAWGSWELATLRAPDPGLAGPPLRAFGAPRAAGCRRVRLHLGTAAGPAPVLRSADSGAEYLPGVAAVRRAVLRPRGGAVLHPLGLRESHGEARVGIAAALGGRSGAGRPAPLRDNETAKQRCGGPLHRAVHDRSAESLGGWLRGTRRVPGVTWWPRGGAGVAARAAAALRGQRRGV